MDRKLITAPATQIKKHTKDTVTKNNQYDSLDEVFSTNVAIINIDPVDIALMYFRKSVQILEASMCCVFGFIQKVDGKWGINYHRTAQSRRQVLRCRTLNLLHGYPHASFDRWRMKTRLIELRIQGKEYPLTRRQRIYRVRNCRVS